jgi:hypothetical protein
MDTAARSLPAVTVWQPWASLIALGPKTDEYRTLKLGDRFVGRWMAIHAGVHVVRAAFTMDPWPAKLAEHGITEGNWTGHGGSLPQRAVVALVRFDTPLVVRPSSRPAFRAGRKYGDWAWPVVERINLNSHPLTDVVGRQGIWYLSPARFEDLETRIEQAGYQVPGDLYERSA